MQCLYLVHVQNEQPVAWRKLRRVLNLHTLQAIKTTLPAMPEQYLRSPEPTVRDRSRQRAHKLTHKQTNNCAHKLVCYASGERYLLLEGVQQGIVPRLACALARVLRSKLPAHRACEEIS